MQVVIILHLKMSDWSVYCARLILYRNEQPYLPRNVPSFHFYKDNALCEIEIVLSMWV